MSAPRSSAVAVIDIGSNTIKALVARRAADGSVQAVHTQSIEARISAGLSGAEPRLGEPGMARGVEAVRALLAAVAPFAPGQTRLVATSAVRDARNGAEFCARVLAATGHAIRILTGVEEANLIGRGLIADPALRTLRDFYVFDLGGGSLECLAFRERSIAQAASLPLGCVRLTEKFVVDVRGPMTAGVAAAIAGHTRAQLRGAGFGFSLPAGTVAVGTGGTVTTLRGILGARAGREFAATDPVVFVAAIRELCAWLGALPLPERQRVAGLPAGRADVFPTALVTMLAVAEAGGFREFRNSLCNLRYGLADELLAA